jgi:hypothetical protein
MIGVERYTDLQAFLTFCLRLKGESRPSVSPPSLAANNYKVFRNVAVDCELQEGFTLFAVLNALFASGATVIGGGWSLG